MCKTHDGGRIARVESLTINVSLNLIKIVKDICDNHFFCDFLLEMGHIYDFNCFTKKYVIFKLIELKYSKYFVHQSCLTEAHKGKAFYKYNFFNILLFGPGLKEPSIHKL